VTVCVKVPTLSSFLLMSSFRTFARHAEWLRLDTVCPFFSIRFYQRIAWKSVKHMVGVERLLWKSPDGPEFEFDGVPGSALDLSDVARELYNRAEEILNKKLLLGLTDEELGVFLDFDDIIDNLS